VSEKIKKFKKDCLHAKAKLAISPFPRRYKYAARDKNSLPLPLRLTTVRASASLCHHQVRTQGKTPPANQPIEFWELL
jgi:hypothetical protein